MSITPAQTCPCADETARAFTELIATLAVLFPIMFGAIVAMTLLLKYAPGWLVWAVIALVIALETLFILDLDAAL